MLRILTFMAFLTALAGCGEAGETARLVAAPQATAEKADRICETAQAVAAGFGEENVTKLAYLNLDREIDRVKDELVRRGARGFSVGRREAACRDYIDFGGSIGREHLCRASVEVCGQVPSS